MANLCQRLLCTVRGTVVEVHYLAGTNDAILTGTFGSHKPVHTSSKRLQLTLRATHTCTCCYVIGSNPSSMVYHQVGRLPDYNRRCNCDERNWRERERQDPLSPSLKAPFPPPSRLSLSLLLLLLTSAPVSAPGVCDREGAVWHCVHLEVSPCEP